MLGDGHKLNKRDKFTLMTEILNNCVKPVKKTHLLYKAEINFKQLDRYLNLLLSLGLLEPIIEPFNGYEITSKGRQFLDLFNSNNLTVGSESVMNQVIKR